ncbi:uncharacterized protein LOC128163635 [Crassostrea angulata]|uniref:uncharacterized protein LOC128163635 n=1 Tax=Magallana angulata TaxID=2784310 RepID=UPI0022B16529|nr:uncharacterized protein LOC128163635 [Crassostrea angulata]
MTVQFLSEIAYHGMCHEIGTPEEVSYRREMSDIQEFLDNRLRRRSERKTMNSGSRKEGFRLNESDLDIMFIEPWHRVIWDMSHSVMYNLQGQTPILCNTSESPPGFALLWLPLENSSDLVYSACVRINGGLYISSSKFREMGCSCATPDSTIHGPCRSRHIGEAMFDFAHCFVSDFWPPAASSWIDRCHSWPPQHVTDDIVRNGCHFVAIGNKAGNHADIEWRISFSQAENKLVYSMNHTQFLNYGLLKLFLNEVINAGLSDEEKLLCSYHMKTAIFWAIQQNMLPQWCPENILAGFWICFKLILKWVYQGVCPNFFIPKNNLFLSRIYGRDQRNLFRRLYHLYEKGLFLLLHISSMRQYIPQGFIFPDRLIVFGDCNLGSEFVVDFKLSEEIKNCDRLSVNNLQDCAKALLVIEQLTCLPLNSNTIIMLQKHTATILQCTAFVLHNKYIDKNDNKNTYIRDKKACHLLRLSMKFGYLSDMLYIAMFYYKTFRYKEALSIIDISKVKMSQPYVMLGEEQRWTYTEGVGGRPWSIKMRHAITSIPTLDNTICYMTELLLEQQSSYLGNRRCIDIPPWILLSFLEFLSCRQNDTLRSQAAVDDIQALVNCDDEFFVPKVTLDISWEILGICQQITGNIEAARFSFQQSLKQYPYCEIKLATRQRINAL